MNAPLSFALFIFLLSSLAGTEKFRTFTSSDGKPLVASLVHAEGNSVRLLRQNDQKEFTLPLSRLSAEDQIYIQDWLKKKRPHPSSSQLDQTQDSQPC